MFFKCYCCGVLVRINLQCEEQAERCSQFKTMRSCWYCAINPAQRPPAVLQNKSQAFILLVYSASEFTQFANGASSVKLGVSRTLVYWDSTWSAKDNITQGHKYRQEIWLRKGISHLHLVFETFWNTTINDVKAPHKLLQNASTVGHIGDGVPPSGGDGWGLWVVNLSKRLWPTWDNVP